MFTVCYMCRRQFTAEFRCVLNCITTFRPKTDDYFTVNLNTSRKLTYTSFRYMGTDSKRHSTCNVNHHLHRHGHSVGNLGQNYTLYGASKDFLRPGNTYTPFVQTRNKSRKRKDKTTESEESTKSGVDDDEMSNEENSDDDDDDNDNIKTVSKKAFPEVHFPGDVNLSPNYKMLKKNISQARYDSICRFGLNISSKTFLTDLSEQRCKLNGLPLKLKRTIVKTGDALDVLESDDKMRRIRVVSLTTTSKNTVVCLRVWRAPFLRSLVKE